MASNRVGFKQFLNKINQDEKVDIIIDSNILIAFFDQVHSSHDQVRYFLEELDSRCNVTFYTTVTTKSEFLDYQRKRYLTSGVVSLVQENKNDINISPKAKATIQNTLTNRNNRLNREEKKQKNVEDFNSDLNYFYDNELKDIKKSFKARDLDNESGWLMICEKFLGKRLERLEQEIDGFCEYLTTRNKEQKENVFIVEEVDWKKATSLSSQTGMGYSDSMILNMALSTNIENVATLDFDLVYAGAVSASNKNILLPDSRIAFFKQILKKLPKS
jgi:predicted nucleic acid-binding protein